jgi:hypothetical protein
LDPHPEKAWGPLVKEVKELVGELVDEEVGRGPE